MKKISILITLLSLFITSAYSQEKVYIHLYNGDVLEKEVWEIDSITFSKDSALSLDDNQIPEAVDLGLSVKWGSFNIGADSPSKSGWLVGWGDTSARNHSSNLRYFPVEKPSGNIVAGNFDIAKKLLGDEWHMPDVSEWKELVDSCQWVWSDADKAFVITAKNGNSIVLPLTGRRSGDAVSDSLSGFYWTGVLNDNNIDNAQAFVFTKDDTASVKDFIRYYGLAVRPVYGVYLKGIYANPLSASDISQTTAKITITVSGDTSRISEAGIVWSTDSTKLDVETGNKVSLSSLPSSGNADINLANLTEGTKYFCRGYALVDKNYLYGPDTLRFSTAERYPVADIIDLGLSVKWASWNIGASSPYQPGEYIAWGDSTGVSNSMSSEAFPIINQSSNISGTKYDFVHRKWGGNWQMPTFAQIVELSNGCDWQTTVVRGVYCLEGTSKKNGNKIYLPMAGYVNPTNGTTYYNSGRNSKAYYWSSNQYNSTGGLAVDFMTLSVDSQYMSKPLHVPIRPVYVENSGTHEDTGFDDKGEKVELNKAVAGNAKDLGLSVYWADVNVGASSEIETGEYFAWGEIAPKSEYTRENYAYYNSATGRFNNPLDTIDISRSKYDVARMTWGGKWRMPTREELYELTNNCNFTWDSERLGFIVTNKNGQGDSIFLPVTGYKSDTGIYNTGTSGCYWSSRDYDRTEQLLYQEGFSMKVIKRTSSVELSVSSNGKQYGYCIRPVMDK